MDRDKKQIISEASDDMIEEFVDQMSLEEKWRHFAKTNENVKIDIDDQNNIIMSFLD